MSIATESVRGYFKCIVIASLIGLVANVATGAFTNETLPSTFDEIYRYSPGIHTDFPDVIRVNRANQLATLLNDGERPRARDYNQFVMYYSKLTGISRAYLPVDHRVFGGWAFSDWGVAFATPDGGHEPNKVWSGRFGEPLAQIFTQWTGAISRPGINDKGVVAFASRIATNHGNRDLWRYKPGASIESLPDLGEDALLGPTIVDPVGRVVKTHSMGSSPNLVNAAMRLETNGEWLNLLKNFNESSETIGRLVGEGGVNAAGDFAFATSKRESSLHTFKLHVYSAATDTTTPIFASSRSLNEISNLTIADNGNIFFRFSFSGSGYASYLYRKNENRLIDLSALAPAGSELIDDYSPSMNQNGDLLFGVWDAAEHTYTYSLWPSNASEPHPIRALSNLPGEFHEVTLSNNLTAYAWTWLDNRDWVLGSMAVPEPSGFAIACTALGSISIIARARGSRLRNISWHTESMTGSSIKRRDGQYHWNNNIKI